MRKLGLIIFGFGISALAAGHKIAATEPAKPPGEMLIRAAREGRLEQVAQILKDYPTAKSDRTIKSGKGFESIYNGWTALDWAVERDDRAMVEMLLAGSLDPTFNAQFTPRSLLLAKSRAVAAKLIDAGADVNNRDDSGNTPLHFAKSASIADLLIEHGADIEEQDGGSETPLHTAARWSRTAVAQTLLDHGATIDPKDSSGQTPLFFACEAGNIKLTRLLIDRGAKVNVVAKYGNSPIWMAAGAEVFGGDSPEANHAEVIRLLVKHGASLAITKDDGRTLLHQAAHSGRPEVARYLIESGLDVNAKDKNKRTPLHRAVECFFWTSALRGDGTNQIALVELLLAHGADMQAEAIIDEEFDHASMTPLTALTTDLITGTSSEGVTPQMSGAPGEVEEYFRRVETAKRTKEKVVAMLREHGAK